MLTCSEYFGYVANPDATAEVVAGLAHPLFGVSAHDAMAVADTEPLEDTFLYESLLKLNPNWERGAQPNGSCVGWGWALGQDIVTAVDIDLMGEPEQWPGRTLEASIYGFSRVEVRGKRRAGREDGSYGGAAAKAVTKYGSLHYRQYPGHDLRELSKERELVWGDTGVPDDLEKFAARHRIKTTSLVTTFEEAAVAIAVTKSPVVICSGQGFQERTRDADGFCRPSGEWQHCMLMGAAQFRRPGLLCLNSWGKSNDGPHWPPTMPQAVKDCSFWIDADVIDSMLRRRDSFTLSQYDGFRIRKANARESVLL